MSLDFCKRWDSVYLHELCSPKQWKTISTKELTQKGYIVYGANGIIGRYSKYTHSDATLMITCRGATCGNLHISKPYSYINGNAMALDSLKSEVCLQRYLYYFLRNRGFEDIISGSAQPQITQEGLRNVIVPLAPLNEQKRIADKLDSLLKRVDACRERLDRVPLIIKRFRQAVLAAATSGALTEDWRESCGRDASTWNLRAIGDLITGIEAGINVQCEERPPNADERGLVKISAVTWGIFNDDESKTLPSNRIVPESTRINVGDFLISRANTIDLVGACVIVHQAKRPVFLSDKVLRLVMPDTCKEWLLYCLRSNIGRRQIEQLASGNQLSMRNLSQANLKSITVPVPLDDELFQIVCCVKKLFAFAGKLEARYNAARKQVEQLTPALLAKAFRGELVDQDPNDEPAAVLLERIRAERAGQETKQRRGTAMRPSRKTHKPEPATLPLAAEPAPAYGNSIPQRILAAMKNGADYSRADLLAAAGISETEWLWAIRRLKAEGLVIQEGERRGARYRKA